MTRIELRRQVELAISQDWPGFSQSHPKLAAVLDQNLLVEEAILALEDDPQYIAAMANAMAHGTLAQAMNELIARFVQDWLRRLI
ncbi:MAG: hypothetical protein IT447_02910 [Phycisphaerales bacterium]|jgi:hypothetical protein|nr:hypothetical protein [Phycisphaerales bacterium]